MVNKDEVVKLVQSSERLAAQLAGDINDRLNVSEQSQLQVLLDVLKLASEVIKETV